MSKIELGEYTKEQLFTILGSKDLSNIKRDLTKQGYSYTTNNKRGNNYRLTITAVPVSTVKTDIFRNICKSELGITENIDFDKLAILVCFLEYDTNFVNLTLESMESRIKEEGFIISRKTIAKYLDILEQNNILVWFMSEYVYYVPLDKTKFITRKQWLVFWDTCYNGPKEIHLELSNLLGGRPYKRHKRYFGNALVPAYFELVENAKTIVKEIRKNEQASIH